MFTGVIGYGGNTFYIKTGYDVSDSFSLRLVDGGLNKMLPLWTGLAEPGVHIGLSNVKVGVGVGHTPTRTFFCHLAAIVRWIKMNCRGVGVLGGFSDALSEREYRVPLGDTGVIAVARLRMGNLVYLDFDLGWLSVHLEDDGVSSMFYRDKVTSVFGFSLDKETLGFDNGFNRGILQGTMDGVYKDLDEVIAAHPDRDFVWLRGRKYYIVKDDMLDELYEYFMSYDGLISFDTETTGLDITFRSRQDDGDVLVGVILSYEVGVSYFFPLRMNRVKNLCGGDHTYVMGRYIRPILETKKIVCHNTSFDWKVAYIYGINTNIVHDTMALLLLTICAENPDFSVGLKEATRYFLGRDSLELSDLVVSNEWGESDDITFADLPEELVKYYACADTDNTLELLDFLLKNDYLGRYGANKVYEIEISYAMCVGYQEFYGHKFDMSEIEVLREEIYAIQDKEMRNMRGIVGHDFNPNSSPQLMHIMYNELGVPKQYSRKTGNLTSDKKTLKRLAELRDINDMVMYPFCYHLLEFRKAEGVRKIIDKLPELVRGDGFVHSRVQQYGTTTGRISTKDPNYQSYNDQVKKRIVARQGFWICDTDYSSVEYRILANMSNNENVKKAFEDPDFDYHAYQAGHMYRVPYALVSSALRKAAKGVNFGIPYGMEDESLGEVIFGEVTPENTRKAAMLRKAYFKGQEPVADWFEQHRDFGVNRGYTETFFGRRRYYDKRQYSRGSIRRQAGNHVIQGCLGGDTRICTKELGIVKLEDVVGGVYNVWDGGDWTKGAVTYSGQKRKCIVKFSGGMEMVCSPDHKFKVRSHRGKDRFVRCEDLLAADVATAAHRVVITEGYGSSDNCYVSPDTFFSDNGQANNFRLSDIKSRFGLGVFLGRLASDGSYAVYENRGSHLTQIVAEHEESVKDVLKEYMGVWGYSKRVVCRENRNQSLSYLSVYSKSLAMEVSNLDVKHCVHDNIFMDTEVLRGFLSGIFDGDGGVTGKAITLVAGVQSDFSLLFKDLQKALLFFGVRSRFRRYKDRFVLQIMTYDNSLFLDRIGFINEGKNDKARGLLCKCEERVFGKTLLVKSVVITDDYIDMYDVCNTERGYFVADGVVTHNSAADLYKLAVGNLFKRVCREGWLGMVLFPFFVHDELVMEVSNDIDKAVWLRVLREEFELKVYNSDGSQWCPLYMGFGYGRSWYEAKTVELPIRYQWEIVEKYGESGFGEESKDTVAFCEGMGRRLWDFSIRDIGAQLLDEASQGKEIKPALNKALLGRVSEDVRLYNSFFKGEGSVLEDSFITGHVLDSDGVVLESLDFDGVDTQAGIDIFCALHGYDRSKVDILSISDELGEGGTEGIDTGVLSEDHSFEDGIDDMDTPEGRLRFRDKQIRTFGNYISADEGVIYCMLLDSGVLELFKKMSGCTLTETDGYRVCFVDTEGLLGDKGKEYLTSSYVPLRGVRGVQDFYLNYFCVRGGV